MGDRAPDQGLRSDQSKGKIKPAPTTFFDILVERDVAKRGQKIAAAAHASMNVGDALNEAFPEGLPPSDVVSDPSYNVMANLPHFLQELAGDVYLDTANIHLGKSLGEGGFAVVHKAELKTAKGTCTVAIKALKPGIIEDDADMRELIQEANLLRKVHHKYIVAFCGVGSFETESVTAMRSSVFFAEEFMAGGTLKHLILKQMKRRLPRKYKFVEALQWCMQVAEAISYLHNSTPIIVHRDLKPENVLLTATDTKEAEAKIADFGLHKRLSKIDLRKKSTHPFSGLNELLQSMDGAEEGSNTKVGSAGKLIKTKSGQMMGIIRRLSRKSSQGPKDPDQEALPHIKEDDGKGLINAKQPTSLAPLEMEDGADKGDNGKRRSRKGIARLDGGQLGNIGSVAGSTVTGMAGSLMYMAPEVIRGERYNEEVDVFSFALIMYELFRMELTIVRLLASCTTIGEMQARMQQYSRRVAHGFREPILQHWPPAVRDLISQCWSQDPKQRPTMGVVLEKLADIASSGVVETLDASTDLELEMDKASSSCHCCVLS
eukprot:evm.model.scf_300.2 EVM.evm.TU.scf_300.2   scf_300:43408-50945(-)